MNGFTRGAADAAARFGGHVPQVYADVPDNALNRGHLLALIRFGSREQQLDAQATLSEWDRVAGRPDV